MAIGNWELMHECFPKHSGMDKARLKLDKTDEAGKKRGVSMKSSKESTKNINLEGLSLPNQNTIIINKYVCILKDMNEYNEIQIRKNKMDLNNRKLKNPPPSPVLK